MAREHGDMVKRPKPPPRDGGGFNPRSGHTRHQFVEPTPVSLERAAESSQPSPTLSHINAGVQPAPVDQRPPNVDAKKLWGGTIGRFVWGNPFFSIEEGLIQVADEAGASLRLATHYPSIFHVAAREVQDSSAENRQGFLNAELQKLFATQTVDEAFAHQRVDLNLIRGERTMTLRTRAHPNKPNLAAIDLAFSNEGPLWEERSNVRKGFGVEQGFYRPRFTLATIGGIVASQIVRLVEKSQDVIPPSLTVSLGKLDVIPYVSQRQRMRSGLQT